MNKVQLSRQFIIFYNSYVITLYYNIHNNYYSDAFGNIRETIQSRNEMVQVNKEIIQTTGRHLLEISATCEALN